MTTPRSKTTAQFRKTGRGEDGKSSRLVTRERLSADLEAFEKAGGQVEKLGTTQVLKKLEVPST